MGFEVAALIALSLFVAVYALRYVNFAMPPFEDAAMTMRYAEHVAQGNGIVWNVGEHPVDGATDFFFMVLLAGFVKLGSSVTLGARLIGFISYALMMFLVYIVLRKLHRVPVWVALSVCCFLATGTGLGYIAAYFSTTFYALFAAVTWGLGLKIMRDEVPSHRVAASFAFSALILGLIRPEGVFLAVLMLIAIAYDRGYHASRRVVLHFLAWFGLLGSAYFLWRWSYFGHPLPNPFYKKGGGVIYWSSLLVSIKHVLILTFPFTAFYIFGFRSREAARHTIAVLIPPIGFTLLWILLSNEMNYLMRFQYAILPIVLMSWVVPLRGLWADWHLPTIAGLSRRGRVTIVSVVVLSVLGSLLFQHLYQSSIGHQQRDGRYNVALKLREYRDRGYTIATTEAGLLPFYSSWRAIDTWGLNDVWIAHHGGITEEYLDRYHPEVIMMNAHWTPITSPAGEPEGDWDKMVQVLQRYAEKHGYRLAAAFGVSPFQAHYYYVRPDFVDSDTIVQLIRSSEYPWYKSGELSIDFAAIRQAS